MPARLCLGKILELGAWGLEFWVVRFGFWVFRGRQAEDGVCSLAHANSKLKTLVWDDKVFTDSLGSLRFRRGWVGLSQPGQACLTESGID